MEGHDAGEFIFLLNISDVTAIAVDSHLAWLNSTMMNS